MSENRDVKIKKLKDELGAKGQELRKANGYMEYFSEILSNFSKSQEQGALAQRKLIEIVESTVNKFETIQREIASLNENVRKEEESKKLDEMKVHPENTTL